jgi:hypothetical protein
VIDFHLQHGLVHSDGRIFYLARAVDPLAPDEEHPDLIAWPLSRLSPVWHVWIVAGNLSRLLGHAGNLGIETLTFQRRNNRLHRLDLRRLFNRPAH